MSPTKRLRCSKLDDPDLMQSMCDALKSGCSLKQVLEDHKVSSALYYYARINTPHRVEAMERLRYQPKMGKQQKAIQIIEDAIDAGDVTAAKWYLRYQKAVLETDIKSAPAKASINSKPSKIDSAFGLGFLQKYAPKSSVSTKITPASHPPHKTP